MHPPSLILNSYKLRKHLPGLRQERWEVSERFHGVKSDGGVGGNPEEFPARLSPMKGKSWPRLWMKAMYVYMVQDEWNLAMVI